MHGQKNIKQLEGLWQETEEQYTRRNYAVTVIKPRRYDGLDMQHVCGQQ